MDTVHWSQEIAMKPMEDIVVTQNSSKSLCSKTSSTSSSSLERRSARPQKESAVNCPRCNSTNTKFCYYNNYSLSQPRYFCKTCRRYWTDGGSLRNVPVGGGSRKNRRSSSSSSSSSISSHSSFLIPKKLPDLVVPPPAPTSVLSQNPIIHHENGQDLNLGFPSSDDFKTSSCSSNLSALELLTGITTRGIVNNSFMPIPIPDTNSVYSSSGELMLPMPDFKIPSLNFSLDGIGGNGDGGSYGGNIHESSNGRLLFPFEDLKTASTISTTTTTAATATTDQDGHQNVEENRDENGDSNGFWTGMLGGGSW